MREIKFRAWDKDANTMADWSMVQDWVHALPWDDMFANADCILEQYTGRKDKNGVEIYEGDITRRSTGYVQEIKLIEIRASFSSYWAYDIQEDDEVIGNIHENPELLKGHK